MFDSLKQFTFTAPKAKMIFADFPCSVQSYNILKHKNFCALVSAWCQIGDCVESARLVDVCYGLVAGIGKSAVNDFSNILFPCVCSGLSCADNKCGRGVLQHITHLPHDNALIFRKNTFEIHGLKSLCNECTESCQGKTENSRSEQRMNLLKIRVVAKTNDGVCHDIRRAFAFCNLFTQMFGKFQVNIPLTDFRRRLCKDALQIEHESFSFCAAVCRKL